MRTHDSIKYPYTKVEDLPGEMKQFYEELFIRLRDPKEDPESLAGWIEYHDHSQDVPEHFLGY